jgi:hypothetical protein
VFVARATTWPIRIFFPYYRYAPDSELWNQRLKFVFVELYVDWALACLRHSLCLGGWAAPLPRTPPKSVADIAPGVNGILWSRDGAPVPVVAAPLGAPPAAVDPEVLSWARVGGSTGAAAPTSAAASASSTGPPGAGPGRPGVPAGAASLTHDFKPNPKAERMGLTSEDYSRFMAMLPPNLKLRQRKRLKLIHSLKEVSRRGGDPLALVKQMFPHGGEREIVEAGKKQLPSSMVGADVGGAGRMDDDDDDDDD